MGHSSVLSACEEIGIRPAIIRLLAGYLYDRRTVAKWGQDVSREFPALAGCGQGTILSVLLFVITINILLQTLKKRIAQLESGEGNVAFTSVRAFVDDISLLIPIYNSQHEDPELEGRVFQDLDGRIANYIKVITDFCAETGMKLNYGKTEAVSFDWSQSRVHYFPGCLSFLHGDIIEVKESLILLGLPIDQNLTFKTFAKERRRKGMFALWKLLRL